MLVTVCVYKSYTFQTSLRLGYVTLQQFFQSIPTESCIVLTTGYPPSPFAISNRLYILSDAT